MLRRVLAEELDVASEHRLAAEIDGAEMRQSALGRAGSPRARERRSGPRAAPDPFAIEPAREIAGCRLRRSSYAQSVAPLKSAPKMSMFAALKLSEYSSETRSASAIRSVFA